MMEKNKKTLLGFSKSRILSSKKYQKKKDVLSVLLEDGKTYSLKQVDDILNKFLKKEVK